tara:strand:+ start:105 stop:332 length:228 start_codon:yes stop_codon:yes gene_type:complete
MEYMSSEILYLQGVSCDFYNKVIPRAISNKAYQISINCHKEFEKFYVFAKNRVYSVSFSDVFKKGKMLKWSGKKI